MVSHQCSAITLGMPGEVLAGVSVLAPWTNEGRPVVKSRESETWNYARMFQWFPNSHFPSESFIKSFLSLRHLNRYVSYANSSEDFDGHLGDVKTQRHTFFVWVGLPAAGADQVGVKLLRKHR